MNVTGTTDNYHSIDAGDVGNKRVIGVRSNKINYSALYTTNQGRMWIKFLDANLNPVVSGVSVGATIFYI